MDALSALLPSLQVPEHARRLIPKPRVSLLVQQAIQEIKDTGVEPTVDEIVWLHSLAVKYILPSASRPSLYLRSPLTFKGVRFHPLTIQARMWLERCAFEWWPGEQNVVPLLAFAMGVSFEAYVFDPLYDQGDATKTYTEFLRGCKLTAEELTWCVSQVLGIGDEVAEVADVKGLLKQKPEPDDPDCPVLEWGEIVNKLVAATGLHPRTFLSEMSEDACFDLLRKADKDMARDGTKEKEEALGTFRMVIASIKARAPKRETEKAG
jgi:hypothetical protein